MIQIKSWQKVRTMQDECQREFIYLHTLFHRKRPNWWKRPPWRRFRIFFGPSEVRGGGGDSMLILFSGKFCFDTVIMLASKHKSLGSGRGIQKRTFRVLSGSPGIIVISALNPEFHEFVQLIFNNKFEHI